MLDGVEQTALGTIELVQDIHTLMGKTKYEIRDKLPKIYSKDLVEILFMHPYTKIEFLVRELDVTRKTASKYLNELENIGMMETIKMGKSKYFIHKELFARLKQGV